MTLFADHAEILIRPRHRLLRVLAGAIVVAVVIAGLVAWGLAVSLKGLGNGLDRLGTSLGRVIAESGGIYAARAANVASSEGVALGSLTTAEVQRRDPTAQWLLGTTAAINIGEVSMSATSDHVITAFETAPGSCSYGLAVGLAGDPIVVADGLPGSGVFYDFVDHSTSCAASLAPTSGWQKVSSTLLHDTGVSIPQQG